MPIGRRRLGNPGLDSWLVRITRPNEIPACVNRDSGGVPKPAIGRDPANCRAQGFRTARPPSERTGRVPQRYVSGSPRENGNNRRWLVNIEALANHLDTFRTMPREARKKSEVPSDEFLLANWVRYQRRRRSQGSMPVWQEDLLNKLTGFSWDPHSDSWHYHCELLRAFLEGQRRLPRYRANDPSERELAAWVHKQRHLYRRGQLLPERVATLRQLPFLIT